MQIKNRIEVNVDGDFFINIPVEIMEEYELEEGDLITWNFEDECIILDFDS